MAPSRVGCGWRTRCQLRICAGLGFPATGTKGWVQICAAAEISGLFPGSRRAKNQQKLRDRTQGNADPAPEVSRISAISVADYAGHISLPCAPAYFPLVLPAGIAEAIGAAAPARRLENCPAVVPGEQLKIVFVRPLGVRSFTRRRFIDTQFGRKSDLHHDPAA